jgi:hypothetical protein
MEIGNREELIPPVQILVKKRRWGNFQLEEDDHSGLISETFVSGKWVDF